MNNILKLVLLLISAICFAISAFNVTSKINLISVGLFTWVLTILVPLLH